MFTVEATNFELTIEIKLDQVRLFVPERPKLVLSDAEIAFQARKSAKEGKKPDPKNPPPIERPESVKRMDYEPHNLNPNVKRVIDPIANKWFPLREFIQTLKSIGLNIFPDLDSEKFVTITNKNKKLERLVYRNMALCSCLLSFSYSKWNAEINDESSIVMLQQIHMKDQEPNPVNQNFLVNSSSTSIKTYTISYK